MQDRRTYNLYCDESCHLRNDHKQYMVLGYVSVRYNQLKIHKKKISSLREKHKFYHEIKWTNLSESMKHFYFDLIDYFFSAEIFFRAIIVDKKKYKEQHKASFDEFYYKMYYQLIFHKLHMFSNYNIYLDFKDDLGKHKIATLKKILSFDFGVIRNVQLIRSHESSLLQLCDVLIGAISYHNNIKEKKMTAKVELIEKIKRKTGCSLENTTNLSAGKFNLFFIDLV